MNDAACFRPGKGFLCSLVAQRNSRLQTRASDDQLGKRLVAKSASVLGSGRFECVGSNREDFLAGLLGAETFLRPA
jgi:hypothetical protein